MLEVELAGERVHLHADRALWWPRDSALVLADVHIGKDHIFQRHGIPIPTTVSAHQLARITDLLLETKARRLVVLGDFLHGALGPADSLLPQLAAWRAQHRSIRMDLVLGNHDRGSMESILCDLFEVHAGTIVADPFRFVHEPARVNGTYTLAGHLHPGFVLREGRSAGSIRSPAFWFRPDYAVLPAFGSFTGLARIERVKSDRVFLVGNGEIVQI